MQISNINNFNFDFSKIKKWIFELTPIQKRVLLLGTAIISSLALICIFYISRKNQPPAASVVIGNQKTAEVLADQNVAQEPKKNESTQTATYVTSDIAKKNLLIKPQPLIKTFVLKTDAAPKEEQDTTEKTKDGDPQAKAEKINIGQTADPKKDIIDESQSIERGGKKEEVVISRNYTPSTNCTKSISARLEKNIEFAREQQNKESDKGFTVDLNRDFTQVFAKKKPVDIFSKSYEVIAEKPLEFIQTSVQCASAQGGRPSMEDQHLALQGSLTLKNNSKVDFECFGVFDGHGGANASHYVQKNLEKYLSEALISEPANAEGLTEEGIFKALKACFINLDTDYCPVIQDGTTATVALLINGKIWVANVGDSRTILIKNGTATQASEDAKPTITRYVKTVKKLGGSVFPNGGLRVNGVLAVTRAIGDKYLTDKTETVCVISPKPKNTSYSIEDFQGGYILLACDGLFDVATTNEVALVIYEMENHPSPAIKENMAKILVRTALERGSQDNVSVLLVKIR